MATTYASVSANSGARRSPLGSLFSRCVDAILERRMRAAQAELRRHRVLTAETALVDGRSGRTGLREAGRLPFTT